MECILHKYSNLPTVVIKLICSYHTTEFEDKIRNIYLTNNNGYCLFTLSPWKQLQYLEFGNIPFGPKYYKAYWDNLRSANVDYEFAIKYSYIASMNYREIFRTILGLKLFKLFHHKFEDYTLLEFAKLEGHNMVSQYYSLLEEDNIETCTGLIQHICHPEVETEIQLKDYTKSQIKTFISVGNYDLLKTVKDLDKYNITNSLLTSAIRIDARNAKLLASHVLARLSEISSFGSNIMFLISLNIPEINLNINYNMYNKKIDMNLLLTFNWYIEELRNYHKYGIKTPITEMFNLNMPLAPRNITTMYENMCLSDIEYYYNMTKNKKFLTCNTAGYKQSYMFNKYYNSTGRCNLSVKMHGNLNYYKLMKNTLDDSDNYMLLFNPHINELIEHVD